MPERLAFPLDQIPEAGPGVAAGLGLRDTGGRPCPFRGEPTPRGLLLHPLSPWPEGPLRIAAGAELEDVCGNRLRRGFERHAA